MEAKMKLLFEGWRKYLNETNPAGQEMIDRIAAHKGIEPRQARSGAEIKADEFGHEQDPDSDADDQAELDHMAGGMTRDIIEKTIEEFSFNSAKSSQHRWGTGMPIIDYGRAWDDGTPVYTATIPGNPNSPDSWENIISTKGEDLEIFLTRVKELPKQQELPLPEPESGEPPFRGPDPETHRRLRQQTREQGGYNRRGWKPRE